MPQLQPIAESLTAWLNAVLAFIYPETCQLCGRSRATPIESYVCEECRKQVRFIQPPLCQRCGLPFEGAITTAFECSNCRDGEFHFSYARAAVIARDQVLDVIHRYKYNRAFWFERFLAEFLINQAKPHLNAEQWHFIVPVPLYPAKLREREFNQAERLAHRLSRETNIPVNNRLLRRVLPTRTQTLLTRAQRIANVRKAFAMRPNQRLNGERIVLVDDVLTTGATTSACAKVLLAAGASEVCVWTVARGI
jgi:ComF family protein